MSGDPNDEVLHHAVAADVARRAVAAAARLKAHSIGLRIGQVANDPTHFAFEFDAHFWVTLMEIMADILDPEAAQPLPPYLSDEDPDDA